MRKLTIELILTFMIFIANDDNPHKGGGLEAFAIIALRVRGSGLGFVS